MDDHTLNIVIIIVAGAHILVSLLMLGRSLKKSGLKSVSYGAWLLSLLVCIAILVLAILELDHKNKK